MALLTPATNFRKCVDGTRHSLEPMAFRPAVRMFVPLTPAPPMTAHTGTFAPAADGRGTIALDDAPDLPAGRRVRVVVEPQPDPAGPPPIPPPVPPPGSLADDPEAARAVLGQVAGAWAAYGDELDEFLEETRRLRRLTREEARRLRGEG